MAMNHEGEVGRNGALFSFFWETNFMNCGKEGMKLEEMVLFSLATNLQTMAKKVKLAGMVLFSLATLYELLQ